MNSDTKEKLDKMFNPRGLAVFGGVSKLGSFGNSIVMSLLKYGYKGKLYPISPKGGEVAGLKVYKSLGEIKEPVDLASISVPAKAVPEVLEDCLLHGVAGAEIHTSGFAETGEAIGIKLQKKITEILEEKDWLRISIDAASEKTFARSHNPKNNINLETILSNAREFKELNPRISMGYSFVIVWEGI